LLALVIRRRNLMSKSKTKSKASRSQTSQSSAEQSPERRRRIAEAAYYKAERRGFTPGNEERDWLDAESEMDSEPRAR
jgi:hypothetical protein